MKSNIQLRGGACVLATVLAIVPLAASADIPDLGSRRRGADWPAFLGPHGNGKSTETGLPTHWPAGGLRRIWSRTLGASYGIGSVSRGRYLQFDSESGEARLLCLHSETGRLLWDFRYPARYEDLYGYNAGPRCSPVIDGDRVYIYGVAGQLYCLDLMDGSVIWHCDTMKKFGVVQNFFGVGSTPFVYADLLIAVVGGSPPEDQQVPPGRLDRVSGNGSAIVAFDKWNGSVRYQLSSELASYASPRCVTRADRSWGFAFLRGGLVVFDPTEGREDFVFPWRARILESVNASSPVVIKNRVLISEAYGPGAALLEFDSPSDSPRVVWSDQDRRRDPSMKAHWNTPIHHAGYLYGSSGRHSQEAELRCVEWETGRVMWSEPGLTRGSLLYVDGHFVFLGEDGTLRLIRANAERFEQLAEFRPTDLEQADDVAAARPLLSYPAWAAPILARGLLYVRGRDRVACFELIPEEE